MPSSTDRSSAQEHELLDVYVTVSARLWQADCDNLLEDLTDIFVDLLDIDFTLLHTEGMAMVDWQKEVDNCKKFRASANVNYANNTLNSLGWALMKSYGREAEAVPCFRFAQLLYEIAVELYNEEQQLAEERRLREMQHEVDGLSK